MKRIIVTGGTGFIGANLVRRLLKDNHQIHLLVRKESDFWRIREILPDLRLHCVALSDEEKLSRIIKKIRPEWIFHLASEGAYSWQENLNHMVQTNIIGTVNLIQACIKVGFEVFINTGSSSEYGFKKHPPSEDEYVEPNSYYALTKASATLFCRYSAQKNNVNITTLRLYSVYGPYEEPKRLIPTIILYGLNNSLPPLVNPHVVRDFIYIDDVLEAYLLTAANKSQELGAIYNVGTGTMTSMEDVVKTAREIMNIQNMPEWETMRERIWDTNIWVAKIDKIKQHLGWEPRCYFAEGFKRTWEWLVSAPKILDFYKKRYLKS